MHKARKKESVEFVIPLTNKATNTGSMLWYLILDIF